MINDLATLLERLDKAQDWTHISVRTDVLKNLIEELKIHCPYGNIPAHEVWKCEDTARMRETNRLEQLIQAYEKERMELLQELNKGLSCKAHKPMTDQLEAKSDKAI